MCFKIVISGVQGYPIFRKWEAIPENIRNKIANFSTLTVVCDFRGSHASWDYNGGDNGPAQWDSQPVLDVLPLSCLPPQSFGYATASSADDTSPSPAETNPWSALGRQPAVVFLPPHATTEEWNNIVAANKSGVALTGSAALGKVGAALGSVDIAESADEYVFRISLPGVTRDKSKLQFWLCS